MYVAKFFERKQDPGHHHGFGRGWFSLPFSANSMSAASEKQ